MLDVIKVIILGIVEGITEWLPVSSTGHLILVGNVLKPSMSDAFMEMFDVVIQLGVGVAKAVSPSRALPLLATPLFCVVVGVNVLTGCGIRGC